MIPDARFERRGDSLITDVEVPLAVALCGGSFEVEHLDGRKILVSSAPGEVLAPGTGRALCGEGMPKRANPVIRGDLVLRCAVKFPDSLSEAEAMALGQALGAAPPREDGHFLSRCDLQALEETPATEGNAAKECDTDAEPDEPGFATFDAFDTRGGCPQM